MVRQVGRARVDSTVSIRKKVSESRRHAIFPQASTHLPTAGLLSPQLRWASKALLD